MSVMEGSRHGTRRGEVLEKKESCTGKKEGVQRELHVGSRAIYPILGR